MCACKTRMDARSPCFRWAMPHNHVASECTRPDESGSVPFSMIHVYCIVCFMQYTCALMVSGIALLLMTAHAGQAPVHDASSRSVTEIDAEPWKWTHMGNRISSSRTEHYLLRRNYLIATPPHHQGRASSIRYSTYAHRPSCGWLSRTMYSMIRVHLRHGGSAS